MSNIKKVVLLIDRSNGKHIGFFFQRRPALRYVQNVMHRDGEVVVGEDLTGSGMIPLTVFMENGTVESHHYGLCEVERIW